MVIQEKKASWEIKVMRYDNPREKSILENKGN